MFTIMITMNMIWTCTFKSCFCYRNCIFFTTSNASKPKSFSVTGNTLDKLSEEY